MNLPKQPRKNPRRNMVASKAVKDKEASDSKMKTSGEKLQAFEKMKERLRKRQKRKPVRRHARRSPRLQKMP